MAFLYLRRRLLRKILFLRKILRTTLFLLYKIFLCKIFLRMIPYKDLLGLVKDVREMSMNL
jgi:hypothetical protein